MASGSPDDWWNWLRILSASVPETAIEGTARAVESALAAIADELSGVPAEDSSALPTATTRADGSSSAFEPVVVARKPLVGTVAANVLQFGTGALNIDGCRIEASDPAAYAAKGASVVGLDSNRNGSAYGEWTGKRTDSTSPAGRWPANVCLDADQAAALDEQSGTLKTQATRTSSGKGDAAGMFGVSAAPHNSAYLGESGGASRFFYVAKAPKKERPVVNGVAHPTVKPLALMRWLVRLVTPPGGVVLDPFAGSGTTVEAALLEGFDVIGIEREADYLPLIAARIDRAALTQTEPEAWSLFDEEDIA